MVLQRLLVDWPSHIMRIYKCMDAGYEKHLISLCRIFGGNDEWEKSTEVSTV